MAGDRRVALAVAKKELEELYLGVPDDSVNLTFQDLAQLDSNKTKVITSASPIMEDIMERSHKPGKPLAKSPSLDFSKGLEASIHHQGHVYVHDRHHEYHHHHNNDHLHHHRAGGLHEHYVDQRSVHVHALRDDDMSHVSGASVVCGVERGGRRRPGIPHSNICTVCCNYIYICRHRCLVCGRVYCRQCVSIGMGEMTEGRKCIECLGRRFSQRYIKKAGSVGCCMGYSSTVKQRELKWAEKGPRRSGENKYGGNHSAMVSVSRMRSPIGPASPSPMQYSASNPPSFVLNSPYSPYSPRNHHPMPF